MAFNRNPATRTTDRSANTEWKADGFLNFYLPGAGGKDKKLGSIPLRSSNASQASLIKWLEEDPARISVVLARLKLTFQKVNEEEEGFVLEEQKSA